MLKNNVLSGRQISLSLFFCLFFDCFLLILCFFLAFFLHNACLVIFLL